MIGRFKSLSFLFMLILGTGLGSGRAEPIHPRDFDEWINYRVEQLIEERAKLEDNSDQTGTPGISGNSSSLVEQSSASDLLGMALNLAGLTSNTDETKTTSASATVSMYALYSMIVERNPLEPSFYTSHRNWRRISVTLGFEYPEEEMTSSSERATLMGLKVLVLDKRDIAHPKSRKLINNVLQQFSTSLIDFSNIAEKVQDYLYDVLASPLGLTNKNDFIRSYLSNADKFNSVLNMLNDEQVGTIDKIISDEIESLVHFKSITGEAIEAIRRAPQLSVSIQSKQRKETGTDEHRAQVIFDYGLLKRVNLTTNASFEYMDHKDSTNDTRGARLAVEFTYILAPLSGFSDKGPWKFSIGGESSWLDGSAPEYTWQLKLSVPVTSGIEIPASLTWSSRTELINESEVIGRIGFTLDFAKMTETFKR